MDVAEKFVTVEAGERSMVLDAMALLGGNEYLVQQMIERLSETQYNEAEAAFYREHAATMVRAGVPVPACHLVWTHTPARSGSCCSAAFGPRCGAG